MRTSSLGTRTKRKKKKKKKKVTIMISDGEKRAAICKGNYSKTVRQTNKQASKQEDTNKA